MTASKNYLRNTISGLAIMMILSISGLILLILYPQLTFAHQREYRSFHIYANEDIASEIELAIDSAMNLVEQSELYDSAYQADLFFAHNSTFNQLDNLLLGSWAAARATHNNIIVKVPVDIPAQTGRMEDNQFHLSYMIAHELMHCLQAHRYGIWTFNPFAPPPIWILEGYPEYISRARFKTKNPSDLKEEIYFYLQHRPEDPLALIRLDEKHLTPNTYFKSKLMVEYLIEIKGQSYSDILRSNQTEEVVWQDLLAWYKH